MESSPYRPEAALREQGGCRVTLRTYAGGDAFLVAGVRTFREPADAAREAYVQIGSLLREGGFEIVQERIFGGLASSAAVLDARGAALREFGVVSVGPATYIEGRPPWGEGLSGVIVRAVRSVERTAVRPIWDGQTPCGRTWTQHGSSFIVLQNLHGLLRAGDAGENTPSEQARRVIERAQRILGEQGASFADVVRTWFYLSRILDWYDAFNAARNRTYRSFGLLGAPASEGGPLPASTGIGGENPHGASTLLDLLAVVKGPGADVGVQQMSNPRQLDAVRYGSAFSRGARIRSGGGLSVQVSGTAAIDGRGRSLYPDDIRSQIACTLDTVEALLEAAGCRLRDIAAATVFVKNPGDAAVFDRMADRRGLEPFPAVTVVADICRTELLFEIDAEAVSDRPQEPPVP